MPETKVTAFRFSEEELDLLGVIQGHTGIRSRMEALRAVLQYYVKAEGLQVGDQAADPVSEDGPPAQSPSTRSD